MILKHECFIQALFTTWITTVQFCSVGSTSSSMETFWGASVLLSGAHTLYVHIVYKQYKTWQMERMFATSDEHKLAPQSQAHEFINVFLRLRRFSAHGRLCERFDLWPQSTVIRKPQTFNQSPDKTTLKQTWLCSNSDEEKQFKCQNIYCCSL